MLDRFRAAWRPVATLAPLAVSAALVAATALPAAAHGPTRQKVVETVTIAAPAATVWAKVKNFDALKDWHPAVEASPADKGNTEGSVRQVALKGGGKLTETLERYDDAGMRYSYRAKDGGALPVTNYTSTITVTGDASSATVEWRGAFYRGFPNNDPPPDQNDEAAVKAVTGVYQAGLANLKKLVEGNKAATMPNRRTLLQATGAACLCGAGLRGRAGGEPASAGSAPSATPAGSTAAHPPVPAPEELAAGVYMVRGTGGEPEPANLGRVGNTGFIVGRSGVLAIDTGTSCLHGRALLAAIRSVTDLPVKLALITHPRQEFLFGAAAFREQGIPVAMHEAAAALMASRCETCLKRLRSEMGEAAMQGTALFTPDVRIAYPRGFDAASPIGRSVQLQFFGHSSGPGDIAVFAPRSGTLFAGGLLDAQQIPDVSDGDLPAWQEALRNLQALPLDTLVPGHGPAGGPRLLAQQLRYLQQLDERAAALVKAGAPLSEVPDALALPEFATWRGYDSTHRRNAAIVFLRHERAQLLK